MSLATSEQTTIAVRPLGAALGAEVRGVDMRRPLDAATVQAVHRRLDGASRAGVPRPAHHRRRARRLHAPFRRARDLPPDLVKPALGPGAARSSCVSNVDEDDRPDGAVRPVAEAALLGAPVGTPISSYRPMPMRRLAAARHRDQPHRRRSPSSSTCTWSTTSCPTRCAARSRAARRGTISACCTGSPAAPPPTEAEQAAMPPVWHPMVRRHPVSGGSRSTSARSTTTRSRASTRRRDARLIDDLSEFAAQPQYMYRHVWEPTTC